ncbi:MAG: hypothetical protein HQL57_03320 [Magnetococcales bacterium]|nr:hypothetical protein [Magnetococcales bacterium]MBF0156200.1 hypothetical protein [Magnetococcales bacterium]
MNEAEIQELVSRGLDGDLDRGEIRRLFRSVQDPRVAFEMKAMADLESGLVELAARALDHRPGEDFVERVRSAVSRGGVGSSPFHYGPLSAVWSWLRSPSGLSFQPISFVAGSLVSLLVLLVSVPSVDPGPKIEPVRLAVHQVPFVKATAKLDWNQRFIVPAGDAAQLVLRSSGSKSVHLQFEAAESVKIVVEHRPPSGSLGAVQSLTVSGFGYASLQRPQSGDWLSVRNDGRVPVLVYLHASDDESAVVSPDPGAGEGRAL